MKKSVYVFGLTGRMGQEVVQVVENSRDLKLVGGFSRKNPSLEAKPSPDIIIDFSLPESLDSLIHFTQNHKFHKSCIVSGTTGYSEEQMDRLKSLGATLPVFWSANMSFGVYLMGQLVEKLAKYQQFYEFFIEETHHIHKKDKPSGTALIIEKAAKRATSKKIPILSHREGEVFGLHRFIALSKNERLEIQHEAFNRSLFAQGAIDVARWLSQQGPGFYTMDDFFKDISGVEPLVKA